MRPRKKNFTSWNNWNIELSNDTLIVKIERKSFPQLLTPLLHSFFWDTLYIYYNLFRCQYKHATVSAAEIVNGAILFLVFVTFLAVVFLICRHNQEDDSIKISRLRNIQEYKYQGIRVSRYQNIQVTEYPRIKNICKISEYSGIRISWY